MNFNFKLISCPLCRQGWLFPFQIKNYQKKFLICEECDATWFMDDIISVNNCIDVNAYIRNIYHATSFQDEKDIYDNFEELAYETILEHANDFGGFPQEARDFFVYYSNAFFICECNISQSCLDSFIANCNLASNNDIKLLPIMSPIRIIRYNFRYYCDNDMTHKIVQRSIIDNISQFDHITTQGLGQISYRKHENQFFRHIIYDSDNRKLYWYQLHGQKGNHFFNKAVILHNIFYPEYNLY